MKPIIKVENLSKRYRIGSREASYTTLRDAFSGAWRAPFKWLRRGKDSANETLWALKDVNFEVMPGEVIGVVGRNGAGKSTLLKVLSRITEPSGGRAELYGRVGSLLEVGTGFHPELTGRENIFLNGAILGMKKSEITRKFDEIVAFAEIDKFIDTPVKRYSSGMYVRLAFAVAASLEPEILIVDEVLAVGDMAFQKKCLGKMRDVTQRGRTVLFVSHNMAAIKSLCTRAILLGDGRITTEGDVNQVVDTYLMAGTEMSGTGVIPDDAPRMGTGEAKFRSVQLTDLSGKSMTQFYLGQPFRVTLTLDVLSDIEEGIIEVDVVALDGTQVTCSNSTDGGNPVVNLSQGRHSISLEMDSVLLPRGYYLLVAIHHYDGTTIDWIEHALDFSIMNVAQNGHDSCRWIRGYVRPPVQWQIPETNYVAVSAAQAQADSTLGGNTESL